MVSDSVQLLGAGVLGAAAAGSLYVTATAGPAGRMRQAAGSFLLGEAFALAAIAVLGGGARELTVVFLGVLTLAGAYGAVRTSSLVHATLSLTVALLGVAGVFLTLGAEFLAAIQVLVYVGAVITLILFTVMLTTPADPDVDLRTLDVPAGITVERVETIQSAVPAFTGVGPFKTLRETNPRKVTRIPDTLEGVAITDERIGTSAEPAPKPKEGEAQ